MAEIDIEVKQGILETYSHYPYSAPQVFAEFIDNAIQSAEDNKNTLLRLDPEYILKVSIKIEWEIKPDNEVRAKRIVIEDNAAGMTLEKFSEAFKSADSSAFRKGMNEFGMGMKVAACWLGNKWSVESKSLSEEEVHIIDINVIEVSQNNIKHLPSKDEHIPNHPHGTKLTINAWDDSQIKKEDEDSIKEGIASIYRYFIRRGEIQIYVNDDLLEFHDYDVLVAPSYLDPDGPDIEWSKTVDVDDGTGKYRATGFIALLREMDDKKRGVVIMRNHRVVMGFAPEGRTIGKDFMGQPGSSKYRRVFGEIEISGYSVAFGKNQILDTRQLEALMKIVAGKLYIDGVSLLTQAAKFRKKPKQTPKPSTPNPSPAPSSSPVPTQVPPKPVPDVPASGPKPVPTPPSKPAGTLLPLSSVFKFGGVEWKYNMVETSEIDDLFANDASRKDEHILGCRINTKHPFFKAYGPLTGQSLAIIKAMSIANYITTIDGRGSVAKFMSEFEDFINE